MIAWLNSAQAALADFVALGGWVVALLLGVSVLAGATILWKVWHLAALRVGAHPDLNRALAMWENRDRRGAQRVLAVSKGALEALAARAMDSGASPALRPRLLAEAERHAARAESGFRLLDAIAQTAPLLGLFGTVLGMIEAFQTLQAGGAGVDAAELAGGIWVALLTTALGLGVAMPVSLFLGWAEGRIAREAQTASLMVETLCGPALPANDAIGAPEPIPMRA